MSGKVEIKVQWVLGAAAMLHIPWHAANERLQAGQPRKASGLWSAVWWWSRKHHELVVNSCMPRPVPLMCANSLYSF